MLHSGSHPTSFTLADVCPSMENELVLFDQAVLQTLSVGRSTLMIVFSEILRRAYQSSLHRNAGFLIATYGSGAILGFFFCAAAANLFFDKEVGFASATHHQINRRPSDLDSLPLPSHSIPFPHPVPIGFEILMIEGAALARQREFTSASVRFGKYPAVPQKHSTGSFVLAAQLRLK